MQDQHERVANRGTRKRMKECIKPGNVIADDVRTVLKDCARVLGSPKIQTEANE
jgi:chloramphenicol 3-O-phosphotransferase